MATTHTLRNNLCDIMDGLRNETISIKEAQAMAKLAANIIYATRLELENKRIEMKLARSIPRIDQKSQTICTLKL